MCTCGAKSPAFVTSATLTSNLYINECLQKRVLPMIQRHHCPVMFWPDLASCHYSRDTMNWFESNNVAVIPKNLNPPNCPKFRPIEEFWALMKRLLNKTNGCAHTPQQMLNKWNNCSKKFDETFVQNLMGTIKARVREFIRTGP